MIPRIFLLAALGSLQPAHAAESADTVILAAMRLSDAASYRWVTSVTDDARTYEVRGQTARDGYTRVKMPMVNSVRERLGRSVTDTDVEAIFRGNVRCVLQTEDGWLTVDELPPPVEPPPRRPRVSLGLLGGVTPPTPKLKTEIGYSNLQLSIKHPHEDLGVIVTSHRSLQCDDGVATGSLDSLGAQLLLVHDGQPEITPLQGAGTFKLWIRGGMVTRYQLQLEGVLLVGPANRRKQIRVRQSSDTLIDAIGTTTFDVPPEAQRKLGGN